MRPKITAQESSIARKIPYASHSAATAVMFRRTLPSPARVAGTIAAGGAAATEGPTTSCFPHELQNLVPELKGVPHPSQYMNRTSARYYVRGEKFHHDLASEPGEELVFVGLTLPIILYDNY